MGLVMGLFDPMEQVKFLHGYFRRGEEEIRNFLKNIDGHQFDSNFPHMDVLERNTELLIFIELPGIELEDFSVYQYDDAVIIEGIRNRECQGNKISFMRMERNCSNFRRIVRSPSFVDAINDTALLKDGVLLLKFKLHGKNIEIVEVED